jgi:CheY-like chemotaxis protein
VLRLAGHATRTAHDGVRALEVAETFRPDAVLLDIGMPRLNGYVVAERLRASAWSRSALLVALTGWGQDADKKRAVQAGFDHHLIKPVNVDELLMLLARYADAAATRGSRFSV